MVDFSPETTSPAFPKNTLKLSSELDSFPIPEKIPGWFRKTVKRVSNAWFDPKSFESPELYEKLGIKVYKKYLPTSGDLMLRHVWKRLFKEGFLKNGSIEELEKLRDTTKLYEAIHTGAFGLYTGLNAYALSSNRISLSVFLGISNLLQNVYPIMLQRYNRLRVSKIINRKEKRKDMIEDE